MASSSGVGDAAGAPGERGSPPLRFVCFRPRFWKRRKALPPVSSTAAVVNSASSISAGEPGDSAPLWTARTDSKDLCIISDDSTAASGEEKDCDPLLSALKNDENLNILEDSRVPAPDLISRPQAEGSNSLFRHGYSSADMSQKQEDDYRSPSTELIRSTGTTTDVRRLRARPLSWDPVCLAIDHLVLRHTPSFYDRCRLRCVCHQGRDATHMHPLPPPPLPMVINADFTLLNCFADGALAVAREIKSPALLMDDQRTACVGSFDDWIVCVYPRPWNARQSVLLSDQCCYIMAPSKQKLVDLPNPPAFQATQRIQGLIQVENGSGAMSYTQPSYAMDITLSKVVLTAAPDVGNCKVAAMSERREFITIGTDLEFYEDSLYLVANDSADLFILEFGPQLCFFPVVTRAQRCLIDRLPDFTEDNGVHSCSLVQWNGRLLLMIRKFPDIREQMNGVDVLLLDNKSKPWKWVAVNTLEGQCILISSAYNKSYPVYLYDDIEEDTIYFLDNMNPGYLPREDENFTYQVLVYNVQDKRIGIRLIGSKPVGAATKFPMWFCPAE